MNSFSASFSLFTILSVFWSFRCAPQENVRRISSEENMQGNMVSTFPETATKGSTDMLMNGRGNSDSGGGAHERKRFGWNMAKYIKARLLLFGPRRTVISGLNNEMRISMGSNTSMKDGPAIPSNTKHGTDNGMTAGTNAALKGMSTSVGTSTNTNNGVSMLSETDIGFNNQMGSSMAVSSNFNNLFGAPIQSAGMRMPLETDVFYHSAPGMSNTNPGTFMTTEHKGKAVNGMFIGSNAAWNLGTDTQNAGMNTRSNAGAGINNMERSESGNSGSVMSGSSYSLDMAVGSIGMH